MASPSLFFAAPPFPEDVPVAKMVKISLEKLANGDIQEAENVLAASTSLGFFLLDLHGNTTGEELMRDIDATFEVVKETMSMTLEEKMQFCQSPPKCFAG